MKRCIFVFDDAQAAIAKQVMHNFDIYAFTGNCTTAFLNIDDLPASYLYQRLRNGAAININTFRQIVETFANRYDVIYVFEPADAAKEASFRTMLDAEHISSVMTNQDKLSNSPVIDRQSIYADDAFAAMLITILRHGNSLHLILTSKPDELAYTGLLELRHATKYGECSLLTVDELLRCFIDNQYAEQQVEHGVDSTKKPQFKEVFAALTTMRDTTFKVANDTHRYDNKPGIADVLMHTIGEANEAHVACAANKHVKQEDVDLLLDLLEKGNDDMFKKYFKFACKSTFEDEIADLLLMVLSIAGYYNIDLATHVAMKCKYNSLRDEHSDISDYDKNH
jgi:NTP pyrophosphatase (non-canonical NTP hydrolase)